MPVQTWYVLCLSNLFGLVSYDIAILAVRTATSLSTELHQAQRGRSLPAHLQYWSNTSSELEHHCNDVNHKRMGYRIFLQFLIHLWENSCELLEECEGRKEFLRQDSETPSRICRFGCYSGHFGHTNDRPNGAAKIFTQSIQ